jgi:hypothetical protein
VIELLKCIDYIERPDIERLVCGIVKQAVRDYKAATGVKKSYIIGASETYGRAYLAKDCEDFFKSKWFINLTGIDGVMFLEKVQAGQKTTTKMQHRKRRRRKDDKGDTEEANN